MVEGKGPGSNSLLGRLRAGEGGCGFVAEHGFRGIGNVTTVADEVAKNLEKFGFRTVMRWNRKVQCIDNASMGSPWGTLKNDLVHCRRICHRERPTISPEVH